MNTTGKHFTSYKLFPSFLGIASLLGFLFGILSAKRAELILPSLMRMAIYSPVSIVSLCCSVVLPFLVTLLVVYLDKIVLFFPICFVKMMSYAFCVYASEIVFGSAGWFIKFIFLFTDTITILTLHWLWIHLSGGPQHAVLRETVKAAVFCIGIGLIDVFLISDILEAISIF